MVRWDPDVVLHNYRWVVPVVVPVDRIRRPAIPSVMRENKYIKEMKEKKRNDTHTHMRAHKIFLY